MELKSNVSKYLVVCCVSMLLGLTMAKGMKVTKERCNETLIIPSDFYKIPTEESEGNGNIHTRSLSPWTWKSTTVENRIPQTMWEAECSSMYCVYPTNSSQYMRYGQNSVPIYQQVVVLYTAATRKCYSASFLSVAVGCTCAWARTT
uniref:interleukin-17A-like n=1 Tax=Oncorhynchus gorbuscha TaxID=8017 RepID=UPI001EAF1DF3|nr:interleukin-17A-like [Oncorhynchus gorbuscha]